MTTDKLLLALVVLACLFGQPSLRADDFPAPQNAGAGADGLPLDPQNAAAGFQLPPGFKANAFAAEPDVQNPVAMTWDNRGRLWVAECYTYANRPTRYDLTLRDRVIILHDTDGDGVADQRKVFCDNVQQLMSVEVGLGGVWLLALPRLLFIPDRDGDDVPDGPPETLLDGFEIQTDNYHNCANGLRWGPDGWLYGRCGASSPGWIGPPDTPKDQRTPIYGGIWRYHPTRKIFEVLCHGFTNPWGHDWDEHGEMFITNTVTGHFFHLMPGAHHTRSATITPNRYVYDTIDSHADHFHYSRGRDRGPRAENPNAPTERPIVRDYSVHDQLGGGHAHCGSLIYLGDNWPAEYRGKLLTLNLHGRRINVDWLERHGSGYVAHHSSDIAQSADTWFRGIDLNYGPDGAVYIIDWSDTGECHEHDGIHRTSGRIFRISHPSPIARANKEAKPLTPEEARIMRRIIARLLEETETSPEMKRVMVENFLAAANEQLIQEYEQSKQRQRVLQSSLTNASNIHLVRLHASKNEWLVRHARRELADRAAAGEDIRAAVEELRTVVNDPGNTVGMLRAAWTLCTLNALPQFSIREMQEQRDENRRTWGLRLATDFWPIDTVFSQPRATAATIDPQLVPRLVEMAKIDQSGLVRLTLASILQRLPLDQRPALAAALLAHEESASDHNLPKLVWYGLSPLVETNAEALVPLAANGKLPLTREWITRAIAENPTKNAVALDNLLRLSLDKDNNVRADVVRGLIAGLAGRRKSAPPQSWNAFQASLQSAAPDIQDLIRSLAVVFGDGRALEEVRRIALDSRATVPQRQAAFETLIEARPSDLKDICQQLLRVRFLNTTAMKGLTLFDDPALGEQLAKSYSSFHPSERRAVIETLVTRPTFASALIDQIEAKRIPATDLTALDARQIRSHGKEKLSARLAEVWGELRDSPEEKRNLVLQLKNELSQEKLSHADASQGRAVFQTTCANCHRLFGAGGAIAPDLTGSGRHNLDYLLENIIDPSAVVNKDFRMSVLRTGDGRVLNGLVMSQDDQRVVLQTDKEKLTFMRSEIDDIKLTTLSPMPEGMLQPLKPNQIRDLIAYLQSPTQVDLPVGWAVPTTSLPTAPAAPAIAPRQ